MARPDNDALEKTDATPLSNFSNARWNFGVSVTVIAQRPWSCLTDCFQTKLIYRQGAIEGLFRQAMAEKGLKVKHDTIPTAMELVQSSTDLQDPKAYVTKASAQTRFGPKRTDL